MPKQIVFEQKKLKPFKLNPRGITDAQLGNLENWMHEFGDLSGITIEVNTHQYLTGNQRSKHIDIPTAKMIWTIENQEPDHVGTLKHGYVFLKKLDDPNGPEIPFNIRMVDWPDETFRKRAVLIANKAGGHWLEKDLYKNFGIEMMLDTGWEPMEINLTNMNEEEDKGKKGTSGGGNPIIKYDLVFNDIAEQKAWHSFLKELKDVYPQIPTISQRLIRYIGDTIHLMGEPVSEEMNQELDNVEDANS